MIPGRYIIALFICLVVLSCGKTSIVGQWKQVETEPYDSIPNYRSQQILIISADSSFTLDIAPDNNDTTLNVPGWHNVVKLTGTWRMPDKKHLEMRIDPKDPAMILHYDVLKLTGRELEIIFPGWKTNPDAKSLRYTRL